MKNQISITWYIDDILERDEEMCDLEDERLTEHEARNILELLERNHDANQGITWDVIDYWINELKTNKKKG